MNVQTLDERQRRALAVKWERLLHLPWRLVLIYQDTLGPLASPSELEAQLRRHTDPAGVRECGCVLCGKGPRKLFGIWGQELSVLAQEGSVAAPRPRDSESWREV